MSMAQRTNRWLIPLAAIGAAATARGAFSLFATTGRRPRHLWTDSAPPVDSNEFLRPLAAILGVPLLKGGTLELLNNGDQWLARMLADFKAAQSSITFSAYTWEPGRLSDAIFDALIERASAGVQVRVLVDGLGGKRCPTEDIERLRAAGGEVCVFRPFKIGKIDRYHLRNHRRAMVIDGGIAYTGGMAVADHWLGDARNPEEWRDIMARVTGCLAPNVQSAFAEMWAYVCGEVLTGPAFFPELPDDHSEVRSLALTSSPSGEDQPLHLLFFKSFASARERIWITTPYFVPTRHTTDVLAERAQAGVDVRILLPNHHTDAKAVRRAGHTAYEKLLDAGVRIFEFQPTMIHTKALVVDSKWSIIGSANMDIRSTELNEENVLGILDEPFARDLESAFEADLKRAHEIDADAWRKRSIGARALERVSGFFGEQY
jgi:cardiolipin synthase